MVTTVGLESDMLEMIDDLIGLDYDAIEAYRTAIDRIEDTSFKAQLTEFMMDHQRHTQELSALLREHGENPQDGPTMKRFLTTGKVALADLMGDKAILMAMKTNEEDTNTAYQRAANRDELPEDLKKAVLRGLDDERRHRSWIIDTLAKVAAAK